MKYKILEEAPFPLEYCILREKCGMQKRTLEAATIALPRSLFAVTVRSQTNELIGIGRLVGDLGSHVQIVDIAVDPSFQRNGISTQIMNALMRFIDLNVPECAFVNLFADVDFLYHKFGFELSNSKGMVLRHRSGVSSV